MKVLGLTSSLGFAVALMMQGCSHPAPPRPIVSRPTAVAPLHPEAPLVLTSPQATPTSVGAEAPSSGPTSDPASAGIDRKAAVAQPNVPTPWAEQRAKFVEVLRQQPVDQARGIKYSIPYTVDAAGNIYHKESGGLRRVSDEELQHPSPQMLQEANDALAAAKAGQAK